MRKIFLTALLVSICSFSKAQNVNSTDKKLAEYLQRINDLGEIPFNDSIASANDDLKKYISKVCVKSPIDTHYSLAEEKGLIVAGSINKQIKVYSWNTQMGGTQYNYSSIIIAKTKKGLFAFDIDSLFYDVYEGDTIEAADKYYYYEVASVRRSDNRIIYLFFGMQRDIPDRGEQVFACEVLNNKLCRVPVFKTKTEAISAIEYAYNLFAYANKNKNSPPVIHLSHDNRKLYIPIINREEMTNKYLVYVFDGNNFVYDKNAK